MCGIAGYLHLDGSPADARALGPMLDAMRHRGPDDEGSFCAGPVAMGMRRLAVLDLAGSRQPIRDEETGHVFTYNGECYNFRALRRELEAREVSFRSQGDTEVVMKVFTRLGVPALGRLDAMYAFAAWQPETRELFLARDPVGIKPLFFWEGSHGGSRLLVWASELRVLLRHPAVPKSLCEKGLSEYLRFGYTFAPTTILRGIRKLAPGTGLTVREGRVAVRRHCPEPLEPGAEETRSFKESAALARSALESSVLAQTVADVPYGAFLSSGIDSSAIVSFLSRRVQGPVKTFTIGFGERDRFHDEASQSAAFAASLGTEHHEIRVEPDLLRRLPGVVRLMDEPIADSSILVSYLISELARQHVTVALSGVGGDEVFGGYRRYLGKSLDPWLRGPGGSLVRAAVRGASAFLPKGRDSKVANLARLATRYVRASAVDALARYVELVETAASPTLRRLYPAFDAAWPDAARVLVEEGGGDPLRRMMRFDFLGSLPEQLLNLTDRMSMAVSLEVRVPYLGTEVLKAARRIPSGHKVSGLRLRRVQKAALGDVLGEEVLHRKKRGFGFPLGRWLREEGAGFLEEHLGARAVKARGLFDESEVRNLRSEHAARRADRTDILTALLFLELWLATVL